MERRQKGICDCCRDTKIGLVRKKLLKGYKYLCSECAERMKAVNVCLRSGTDKIIEKLPKLYERATIFSVTPINTDSSVKMSQKL